MPKKSSRINISDSVTLDLNNYRGFVWLHLRRKDKSVSLPLKDFNALLNKKKLIQKIAQKHERGKKQKNKHANDSDSSEYSEDTDSD